MTLNNMHHMATPPDSETKDTENFCEQSDSEESSPYFPSRSNGFNPRKRLLCEDALSCDSMDDGRMKTRRVNPQRLAIRLGPELVAEMEALIVPGAKMPTFVVRKDFQERYSVDRRHIYDYFHSRGTTTSKNLLYKDYNSHFCRLASCQRRQAYKSCQRTGFKGYPPSLNPPGAYYVLAHLQI